MRIQKGRVYENNIVIPSHYCSNPCLIFSNGTIQIGDEVCIWILNNYVVTGVLDDINGYLFLTIKFGSTLQLSLDADYISNIAKKVDGKWILMEVKK